MPSHEVRRRARDRNSGPQLLKAESMRSASHSPAWDEQSLRAPHAQADKARRVEAMFDAIAPTYERVNAIATFGADARWRRAAVAAADVQATDRVLDICCGTGDMLRTFGAAAPAPAQLIGLDFSAEMLRFGQYPGMRTPPVLIRGDALHLPFATASIDVVSCAFGVRNLQNIQDGLLEMRRILRPGGRLVILEFSTPTNTLLRRAFFFYSETVLPRLGRWVGKDPTNAYRYLNASIRTFDTARVMLSRLRDVGFVNGSVRKLNFGGVALYRAEVKGQRSAE